ncbi:pyridoxal phosphate-dependent decarboxylase family protein [Bacillus pumilus]|uniref:2,4-diaminobutyrate decarboxylase n=2 Tax=Bacillus pumilus TaxID=1408 RepID=A8FAZ5_BACP2|nr:pyridoxal-dependent decarboxylase [Bacillus pumilus]ABV61412.1 2,4-diaminobutyrate decarboxylase [Bacillus pumilus SAFR-032]AVI40175.1 aspartate aminotransferase family protein [Bacillus pumilus]MBC3643489.1 aspartate aminotransferase family protein [Bacillus pumilus]MBC3646055.1 aspartate aminotransferase family protein [Bacillus pumilus]MBC3650692.1 aspartate aminotransferase family protein [Bacillus pumilus]
MTVRANNLVQNWFPSEDGNAAERKEFIKLMEQIVSGVDHLKDPNRAHLKGEKNREEDFYQKLTETSQIPMNGQQAELVNEELLKLLHNHPYHTKYFFTNILPMASTPGILGMLTAMLVNGNNLWDVYGPAGAEAEVRVVSMMSKLIGYDPNVSGGYTTWGGQGAIFSGLRLAIAKVAPESLRKGVPQNLYAFCSDAAHYSLFKSMEATGLGTDNLIRIKTNKDHSMDMEDLRCQMERVAQGGGIPVYIVATTGTTDAIAIDDVKGVRETAEAIAEEYGLKVPHIHADSALGGFFAFFNEYDLAENPLQFSDGVLRMLKEIQAKFQHLSLADTMCFDFQKLGQTPYTSSLFLVKNAADLKRLDLEEQETPYVGHRGYGEYHTGYTLECSRMGSSISMLSVLLTFGVEGYQRLLGQFLEVNLAFREALSREIPQAEVVNDDNVGMATLFRIYLDGSPRFQEEISGEATAMEIERNNELNKMLFEKLGEKRDEMFFGDTTKFLLVNAKEGQEFYLSVSKFFVISPYTLPEHIPHIVSYLKDVIASVCGQFEHVHA